MRQKQMYYVLTFRTTTAALSMERFCQDRKIPGRLIPLPVQVSAGCGLAWRIPDTEYPVLEADIRPKEGAAGFWLVSAERKIEIDKIVKLML
jgi:hypothetical protein